MFIQINGRVFFQIKNKKKMKLVPKTIRIRSLFDTNLGLKTQIYIIFN